MESPTPSSEREDSPLAKPPTSSSAIKKMVSSIGLVLSAFLIALGILAYGVNLYHVDGPSMEEALHGQDRLVIWKVPNTWANITGEQYIPNRGDIVVFSESRVKTYGQSNSEQFVKRVIGLPGERVVVKDGSVSVYNDQYPQGFKPDKTLTYGAEHPISSTSGYNDVLLTENELFVLGDNRANSLDSRTFGPIHADQIIGKAVFRIYPFSNIE